MRPRRQSRRTSLAFLWAGLAVLAMGAALPDRSLTVHMLGHCLIAAVAAPLIVLGRPVNLALRALRPGPRRQLVAVLSSTPARFLATPPVAWLLFVATQLAFHVTPLYDSALSVPWLHALEHGLFLGTALLFWEVAIGAAPLPRRLTGMAPALYLILAMPAVDLSAAWLMANGDSGAGTAMVAGMMPLGLVAAASAWAAARDEEARARLEGTA
jgi:cytochrome c oxidase assembly factor CtaG